MMYAYEQDNYYELRVKPHLEMLAAELKALATNLPERKIVDSDIVSVVKQKLLVAIRTVRICLFKYTHVDDIP